jgi:hypothetical protein
MSQSEQREDGGAATPDGQEVSGSAPASAEDNPDLLLRSLEEDTTETEFGFARGRIFKRAAELYRISRNEAAARRCAALAALFDFMLVKRGSRRDAGHGRFHPMWESGGQAYPHVEAFTPEALDAVAAELESSSNPIHRSRCADFLWERRPHHTDARQAVEAYLAAADLYMANGWHDQVCDALDRAAELSLRLGDQGLVARAKAVAFRLAATLVEARQHPEVRWAIDGLETLVAFERRLIDDERSEIAQLAEQGATFYADEGDQHIERSFLGILAKVKETLRRPAAAREAQRRSAETYVAEADRAESSLGAVLFLKEAIQAYADLGESARIETLKRRLAVEVTASESESVTISTDVRIPTAPLHDWLAQLLAGSLEEALAMLMVTLVPNTDSVRAQAQRLRQRFPLQHMVTKMKFEGQRIVGTADSDVTHEDMSLMECYALDLSLSDIQLGLALDKLEAEKGLNPESLMSFLRKGELFDHDTLDMVGTGVERYFAKDYVSALHVLVPQLEDAIRSFLGKLELATTSFDRGLTREKPLDVVLETPQLREGLGENLATYLEVLLVRPEGRNLRNRTGHGLVKRSDCTRNNVQRILHCFLSLVRFAVVQPDVDSETPVTNA